MNPDTVLLVSFVLNAVVHGDEYCTTETFLAECPDNQLIMMTEAQYGMMERNRCVDPNGDMSDLGCSADALAVMDMACSNKKTCDIVIPSAALMKLRCTSSIYSLASLYLRASYECFETDKPLETTPCTGPKEFHIKSTSGYISSTLTSEMGWGSIDCPWIIAGMTGQVVNITVIDFEPNQNTDECNPLGVLKERESMNEITICKNNKRERHLYTSIGSKVEIRIDQTSISAMNAKFILLYKVLGCAELIAPEGAWHKRHGDTTIIACTKQNKTWHLRCDGEKWQGVVGSCDDAGGIVIAPPDSEDNSFSIMFDDIPLEIVLTVAAGILVLLFVCIIALCVRWKLKGQHDVSNQAIYNQSTVSSSGGYATTKPHTRSSWTCTYKAGRQHQADTHIWETPLPEPSADEYTLPTNMRPSQHNKPVPAAMVDSMEYTKPIDNPKVAQYEPHDEYTQPVKLPVTDQNDAPTLPLDKRHSNVNYYYYDPSNPQPSEYMQSSNMDSTKTSKDATNVTHSTHGVPLQETVNPVNKTLIRVDDNEPRMQ